MLKLPHPRTAEERKLHEKLNRFEQQHVVEDLEKQLQSMRAALASKREVIAGLEAELAQYRQRPLLADGAAGTAPRHMLNSLEQLVAELHDRILPLLATDPAACGRPQLMDTIQRFVDFLWSYHCAGQVVPNDNTTCACVHTV